MKVLQDFEYIDVDVWDKSSKECKEYMPRFILMHQYQL
jgi:hypothetical protein